MQQQAGPQPRSVSHGRHRSTSGGGGASGAYQPPTDTSPDLYDFVNAFWTDGQSSRNNRGRDPDDAELDWGKNGYDTVMGRVKAGSKVCDDLRALLKDRATAADDYAKRLNKLSKHHFGTGETGHMERAMLQIKSELDSSAKSQQDFAHLLRLQENMLGDFSSKRDSARKTQQANVEKLWKNMNNQRQHVLKAKSKYQDDAIQINALHAQASLLQGKDLDKATLKLDKAQQTVMVNERDYRNYVTVLKETTVNWNMAWKSFCDLVQDQEEERLEFIKSRMWDYANGLSTLAINEDESAERTRTALEQVDPKTDVRIFVQQYGTGNAIPDPIPFVDVAAKEPPPKQTYKLARFARSSTRIPGVKHSPSAIGDIAKAMGQAPAPVRQQSLPPPEPSRSHSQPDIGDVRDAAGPASRSAKHISMPASSPYSVPTSASPTKIGLEAVRPSPQAADETSAPPRFAVSPSAQGRVRPSQDLGNANVSPSKPGHISAAAFQNRQISPSLGASVSASSPQAAAGRTDAQPNAASPSANVSSGGADDDDENDPLVKALRVLQNTPMQASPRARSSADLRKAAASPSQASSRPFDHNGAAGSGQSRSRPGSPEKPSLRASSPQPQRSQSPSAAYAHQQQQQQRPASRPASRAASHANAPNAAYAQPNRYSASHLASPASAGQYAARPSSPSRAQPAASSQNSIPASLRPSSPSPGANPARSSSPGPGSGTSPQQIPYASPAPQPHSPYGVPSSQPQQAAYGRPAPAAGHGPSASCSQPPAASYRAVSPAPRPASVVSPPTGYAPAQNPYMAQAPSQHFSPAPQQQQQQQHPTPPAAYQSPAPAGSYRYPAAPSAYQQPQYGQAPPGAGGYASPAPNAALGRTPSMHSGVSGASLQQSVPAQSYQYQQPPPQQQQQQQQPMAYHQPMQAHAPPPQQHQQQQQQQQQPQQQPQMPRAQSVASLRAGQAAPPPPTGQYTESGQPILFYVNALFDYAATSGEEFSFSTGDVIAVTGTDPDGWWQGNRVGDVGPSKLFPSK
ncbi:hypothetical protein JCM8202_000184 [Rhodotorula sphaerocarpa]